MNISIEECVGKDETVEVDGSFIVDSVLMLTMADGKIGYQVKEVPAYRKSYEEEDEAEAAGNSPVDAPADQITYLARTGEKVVGQIDLKRSWNHYAYVEDIRVDQAYRRFGIGRRLIEQAALWAKSRGLSGIMLETQNTNVKACRFYESCGFVIGGFDRYLYKGLHKDREESAVYWYLLFE
ncbi:GNAT family N-acetyltransferase [Paenibacillus sp. P26]|nr:GNAT family N-acetyltransferase [Paenibacillus sp. P26]